MKYKILLNGFKVGVIDATSYEKAERQAIYLHGFDVMIENLEWTPTKDTNDNN